MVESPYQVGKSCEAWCTKCKTETEHTIIAMVKDSPKRVDCNTCHSQHNYRLAPVKRGPAKGKVTAPRPLNRKNASWERLLATDDNPEARLYSMTERFKSDEVVDHKSLGIGFVRQVQPGNKIEVLFKSGKKLLVHGR